MPRIPSDDRLDSTLALIGDPYRFISERASRLGSDLFETRLMLRKTICMTGPEAAQLFYDSGHFVRQGAIAGCIEKTLLGTGGVQGLDDKAHRHRKQMFMSLMRTERIAQLAETAAGEWRSAARKWARMEQLVLYEELQELLTRAACSWAGVPLAESEVAGRTREITARFDAAGAIGPRH